MPHDSADRARREAGGLGDSGRGRRGASVSRLFIVAAGRLDALPVARYLPLT
jgi:hypothetical protein